MNEQVILVNEKDEIKGVAGKMEAHKKGLLHRAFSIFVFNRKGEMLLQRRALSKYHSGGLWTNACCSHPCPGEDTATAAMRRLKEEMGFETRLEKIFDFVYKADFKNGLTEHEFDHVYAGEYEGEIRSSTEEVMDYCYRNLHEIGNSLHTDSSQYTEWFRLAFPGIESWWQERYKNLLAK